MQFLNISALWALGALCIPIIIHLFAFRKPQRIVFSNVRLLQNVKQATNSYAKLKHILILISRLLSIAALIFLFSQPFLQKSNLINQIQSVLVYVDNSASMQSVSTK